MTQNTYSLSAQIATPQYFSSEVSAEDSRKPYVI